MTRINCHSAFKHYEMFHSRGCCGDSFGSVFNTTYNINTNGLGGGSFWSGFGLGLGNAFGGMFSGLFGGGMNMFGGAGLFGGGMFGNFAMPWGGGFGNYGLYGGGGTYPSSRTSASDPDCKVIADISGKVKDLPNDATKEKIDALIKDIDNAIDKLDANNYVDQKRTLENLKAELQKKSPKTTTENPSNENKVDPKKKPEGDGNVEKTEGGNDPSKKVTDADVTAAIDAADKTKIQELLAHPEKLSNDQKTMLEHAKEYLEGYSNVKKDDLKAGTIALNDVTDVSPSIDDFTNLRSAELKKDGNNWTIEIKSQGGRLVKYKLVEETAGELIFECTNYKDKGRHQKYVLQKSGTGNEQKLHLMQYSYHQGYGDICVADANKVK